MAAEGDTLTMMEAAAWLNVSSRTLERWCREGRIPSTMCEGVRTFRRSDLVQQSLKIDTGDVRGEQQ